MKHVSLVSSLLLLCVMVLPSSGRTLSAEEERRGGDRPRRRGVVRGSNSALEVPHDQDEYDSMEHRALMNSRKKPRRTKVLSWSNRSGATQIPSTNSATIESSTATVTADAAINANSSLGESTRTTSSTSSSFNLSTSNCADCESSFLTDEVSIKEDALIINEARTTVASIQYCQHR
jgi:hypothetical protein